jgi:hypothetical protein
MEFSHETPTANNLALPFTVYTLDKLTENTSPSLAFGPSDLRDLPLSADMSLLQVTVDWDLDDCVYTTGTLKFHKDGRVDGGMQPPDYYAYSPRRDCTWEGGLQAIDEFDWAVIDEDYEDVQASLVVETPSADDKKNHAIVLGEDIQACVTLNAVQTSGPTPLDNYRPPKVCSVPPASPPWIASPPHIRPHLGNHLNDDCVKTDTEGVYMSIAQEAVDIDTEMLTVDETRIQYQDEDSTKVINGVELGDACSKIGSPHDAIPSATTQFCITEVTPHPWHAQLEHAAAEGSPKDPSELPSAEYLERIYSNDSKTSFEVSNTVPVQLRSSESVPFSSVVSVIPPPPLNTDTFTPEDSVSALSVVPPPSVSHDCVLSAENADMRQTLLERVTIPQQDFAGSVSEGAVGTSETAAPMESLPPPPANMDILMLPRSTRLANVPTDFGESIAVDTTVPIEATSNPLKRAMPAQRNIASQTDEEAPANKKTKRTRSTKSKAVKAEELPVEAEDVKTSKPSKTTERRVPNKLTKETSNCAAQDVVTEPAELLFEEDVRPSESSALTGQEAEFKRDEEAVEPSMEDDDHDMQEHYEDVTASPPIEIGNPSSISQRAPGHTVSNRELASLASDFVPGMHLALHQKSRFIPARAQKSTADATKSTNADNSFFIVEKETLKHETVLSTIDKKKRAGTTNTRTVTASKKAKTESAIARAMRKPAPKREPSQESFLDEEADREDEHNLFPQPKLDAKPDTSTADIKPTPVPKQIVSQKFKPLARGEEKMVSTNDVDKTDEERPLHLGYGKRHTRGDPKLNDNKSKTPSAAISMATQVNEEVDVAAQPVSEPESEELEEQSAPTPSKPNKSVNLPSKQAARPLHVSTSRAAIPVSSITSTPAKNKYGFSPRASRSRKPATTPASKLKIGPKTKTNTSSKVRKSDAPNAPSDPVLDNPADKKGKKTAPEPDKRTTRRASAVEQLKKEEEEVDRNIGKRLRSKGGQEEGTGK